MSEIEEQNVGDDENVYSTENDNGNMSGEYNQETEEVEVSTGQGETEESEGQTGEDISGTDTNRDDISVPTGSEGNDNTESETNTGGDNGGEETGGINNDDPTNADDPENTSSDDTGDDNGDDNNTNEEQQEEINNTETNTDDDQNCNTETGEQGGTTTGEDSTEPDEGNNGNQQEDSGDDTPSESDPDGGQENDPDTTGDNEPIIDPTIDDDPDDPVNYDEDDDLPQGKEIKLKKTNIYMRWFNKTPEYNRTGTYYIYDERIKNDRIRICNSIDACGVNGRVTGWVNISDIIDNGSIKVGDKVVVDGKLTYMADGTGNQIMKAKTIMYVTDVLEDKVQFPNYIGVSAEPLSGRQGWGDDTIISKYVDTDVIHYVNE